MQLSLSVFQDVLQFIDRPIARAIALAIVGVFAARAIATRAGRWASRSQPAARAQLIESITRWVGLMVVGVTAAETAGFDLGAVLATAGFFTIAVGLAAQAGLSNAIAGLFLLIDGPIAVGDMVQIDGRFGVVEGITLLSTWVRTPDNVLVRWPNDFVLKAAVVNYSRQPHRRIEVIATLRGDVSIQGARRLALPELAKLTGVLAEPPVELIARAVTTIGVEIEVRAWCTPEDYLGTRARLIEVVHDRLQADLVAAPPPAPTAVAAAKAEA